MKAPISARILHKFSPSKLERILKKPLIARELNLDSFRKRTLRLKAYSTSPKIQMHLSEVRTFIIEDSCNLVIDLQDNPYIHTLKIGDNFVGRINLSRSSIRKIVIGDNCRCDMIITDARHCFRIKAQDVFSGNLLVSSSCFHKIEIGYYCFALIKLDQNRGRKAVKIGDSFRGELKIDDVVVPLLTIGDDCKGKIFLNGNTAGGLPRMMAGKQFRGFIHSAFYPFLEHLELGRESAGKINLQGCPSLRVVKFDSGFHGVADLSDSGVEYVRTGEGSSGSIILINCENLSLLKAPGDRRCIITSERTPLRVEEIKKNILLHFDERKLPRRYHTPLYLLWYRELKDYISQKHFD